MSDLHKFFAVSPRFVEDLVLSELAGLGASELKETPGGVWFASDLPTAYKACLYSRIASRILFPVGEFPASGEQELYENGKRIPWDDHLTVKNTFAVDAVLSRSKLTHSHYAALKLKDAIADYFRAKYGRRPSVSTTRPDVRINLFIKEDTASVRIDLSGESLHRRGYRTKGGMAPLKENVAAAVLLRAGWPDLYAKGYAFLDPMCGSGTLPVEACLMALQIPPGAFRRYFGFLGWKGHDEYAWKLLKAGIADGLESVKTGTGKGKLIPVFGFDSERKSIAAANECLNSLGLNGYIHFERKELAYLQKPASSSCEQGLIAVNPPYGKRLGESKEKVKPLYAGLGRILFERFKGWKASILTEDEALSRAVGLKVDKVNRLYNGELKCLLVHFDIDETSRVNGVLRKNTGKTGNEEFPVNPHIEMFLNRLKKNTKVLKKWARKNGVYCYRIYDRDLPEYAVAIDVYDEAGIVVREYAPPKEIEPFKAERRLNDILHVLPGFFNLPAGAFHFRQRKKQKGKEQYSKRGSKPELSEVREGDLRFLVNFDNYIDTGLFLDHRKTRGLIRESAAGSRFLNLFGYTGTATVCAAAGRAKSTVTVDASQTYLDWAGKNMSLNGFNPEKHEFVKSDCMAWLESNKRMFDLIFCDSPTFSNSKSRPDNLDIQRDHVRLIRLIMRHCEKKGKMFFSTHFRRFKMDTISLKEFKIDDLTEATLPFDFTRNKHIRQCFRIAWNT
ncbi:MAG: bifunctional 23S rRNA (guanine(2069)-N(7))-methyltransferase RlmK/23S rRNA (guanine(2445)-N(2))-methyltransferase RlmL [Spirochaetales bacterium]|nr:bifunctional 23S rRNA (guanine(2069)-N(7))-methyltransferase RlmK/23S rRNA (guanine(2445)-N(2))-methyltransferase RlmL [Spirochaetales bacterium]